MKKTTLMASLLLVLCGHTLAEPLTFGLFESNDSRRARFEQAFVIGDSLRTLAIGKKAIVLPEGNWVISDVETYAPDVTEEGGSQVLSYSADASLTLQDPDSSDQILFNTNLAPQNPRISFTQLAEPCQLGSGADKGWETHQQQRDSVRENRQSCARTMVRLRADKDGQMYLQLKTTAIENWRLDYLEYKRLRSMPVPADSTLDTLLKQPQVSAYLAKELAWSVDMKTTVARQMGW